MLSGFPPDAGTLAADMRLIRSSGLFNAKWYLATYPEVALAGQDPLEHFVRYGAELDRNPNPHFDSARYRREHPALLESGQNPLLHYLQNQRPPALGGSAEVPADKGVHGCLDRLHARGIIGWAIDETRPGESVELALFVDGEHVLDFDTNLERPDLEKVGLDGDKAGFAYEWPSSLFARGTSVDVRLKVSGRSLKKSPRTVLYGPLDPALDRSLVFDAHRAGEHRPVTIIVPIFNASEAVSECLASLCRRIPAYADVLLLDDCSTDPRIGTLIAEYAGLPRVRALANEVNLGYTRTVNKGIELNDDHDIVLLNSDTVVTERWLDSLRYCAYARPRVATVTALSNNAGAFSVPEIAVFNPPPDHLDTEEFARVVTSVTAGALLEVPTGNGFCMYMRRTAIDALGAFDEQRYPRGYGEENDFCMRALRAGWRNIVSDKAFVLHKRSQSFGEEKATLAGNAGRQLAGDYQEYRTLIARFRDIEFSVMRRRIAGALNETGANTLPRALFVISTKTGGTPQTNLDLMRAVSETYACWLLRCDSRHLVLSELVDGTVVERETHWLDRPLEPAVHQSDQYDQIVANILYRHSITLLHIRHIAWHGLNLPRIAQSQNIPVVYSFHDFYTVCASLNLLDEKGTFCGGRCTAGDGVCHKGLWPDAVLPHLKHRFVHRWQAMFREFLAACDAFVTTAPSVAAIICDSYPELDGKIQIIPHGRDFAVNGDYAQAPETGVITRILVPGNIGPAKGSDLIRRMIDADRDGRYEFHFLGKTAPVLKDVGIHHGTYDRSEFHQRVTGIAPSIGLVFSLCAETYCHTLTEMWSCGIPVLGTDIGAVGDRIRAAGGGWLMDPGATAAEALACIDAAVRDVHGYAERREAIRRWQQTESRWNDTTTMGQEYRRLYQSLLNPASDQSKTLGLLHQQFPYTPGAAFIRAIEPWHRALRETSHQARSVDPDWLLAGGSGHVDALLIQRNAVAPDIAGRLLSHLSDRGMPYLYEIDDPLWDLPADHPDYQAFAPQAQSIEQLIRGAATVITTTDALAQRIRELNPNVTLMPNTLDKALWNAPISQVRQMQILTQHGLYDRTGPRILYMGTKSHADDLEIIQPAIAAILQIRPEVEFLQIGGGPALPGARVIEVPAECFRYPEFVVWFRTIATVATVAVAPLRDTPFNAMKSDIKALDYAAAGLPCVFSAVGPYQTIAAGKAGLLVANETNDWIRAISRLLDDADLRTALVKGARKQARHRHADALAIVRDLASDLFQTRDGRQPC